MVNLGFFNGVRNSGYISKAAFFFLEGFRLWTNELRFENKKQGVRSISADAPSQSDYSTEVFALMTASGSLVLMPFS